MPHVCGQSSCSALSRSWLLSVGFSVQNSASLPQTFAARRPTYCARHAEADNSPAALPPKRVEQCTRSRVHKSDRPERPPPMVQGAAATMVARFGTHSSHVWASMPQFVSESGSLTHSSVCGPYLRKMPLARNRAHYNAPAMAHCRRSKHVGGTNVIIAHRESQQSCSNTQYLAAPRPHGCYAETNRPSTLSLRACCAAARVGRGVCRAERCLARLCAGRGNVVVAKQWRRGVCRRTDVTDVTGGTDSLK